MSAQIYKAVMIKNVLIITNQMIRVEQEEISSQSGIVLLNIGFSFQKSTAMGLL